MVQDPSKQSCYRRLWFPDMKTGPRWLFHRGAVEGFQVSRESTRLLSYLEVQRCFHHHNKKGYYINELSRKDNPIKYKNFKYLWEFFSPWNMLLAIPLLYNKAQFLEFIKRMSLCVSLQSGLFFGVVLSNGNYFYNAPSAEAILFPPQLALVFITLEVKQICNICLCTSIYLWRIYYLLILHNSMSSIILWIIHSG